MKCIIIHESIKTINRMFSFESGTFCAPLKGDLIIPTLFSQPLFDLKKAFNAVDHNDFYPNWLQFYFIKGTWFSLDFRNRAGND